MVIYYKTLLNLGKIPINSLTTVHGPPYTPPAHTYLTLKPAEPPLRRVFSCSDHGPPSDPRLHSC